MNKNKTILATLIGTALLSLNAYAQPVSQVPATLLVTQPVVTQPAVIINAGSGNAYEKEVTPLLREISKKKSVLELRKLDRELEKLDEEALKAQVDREKALNPTPAGLNAANLPFTPQVFPNAVTSNMQSGNSLPMMSDTKEIKVFMVYGYDNNLFAKVGFGNQGGYVVKKGDVLPDGRTVAEITPNFIEVFKTKARKKGSGNSEKIFISGSPEVAVKGGSPAVGGTASSAIVPSSVPLSLPVPQPAMLKAIPSANAK